MIQGEVSLVKRQGGRKVVIVAWIGRLPCQAMLLLVFEIRQRRLILGKLGCGFWLYGPVGLFFCVCIALPFTRNIISRTKICWEAVFMGGCTLFDTGQDQGRDQVGGFRHFLLKGPHRITFFNKLRKNSKPTLKPLFFLFT